MQRVAVLGSTQAPGAFRGRHAIGIDVGGTKIAGGLVDLASGRVRVRRQAPTLYARGAEPLLADVTEMARVLSDAAAAEGVDVAGLGLGVAELVDPKGAVVSDYRIPWRGLDLPGRIAAALGGLAPAEIEVSADVRAAALAEARYGAGRGAGSFYYVTIGTGVSGVLVLDGKPHAGAGGGALVIANGPARHVCPRCGHAESRVVEDIASGPALAAAYRDGATAEEVLAAAAAGEARALEAIDHAARALGPVLALLADALDPERIVVGGGLGSAPGIYFDRLVAEIRAGLWDGYRRELPILRAALGPDAGLVGAAAAVAVEADFIQEPVHRPATS